MWYGRGRSPKVDTEGNGNHTRPSVVQPAQEGARIQLPERVTIALASMAETAREGLLALSVRVGLAVVGEIFEEELNQLVGPRGKHSPERQAYRHGQERRQLTLGGRRVEIQKPRARTKAGAEVEQLQVDHPGAAASLREAGCDMDGD